MRKFIINTDTASDDAVAMCMAFRHPDVDVVACTVVAGNVPLDQAVQNALYTAELCDVEVPIYAGADRPMLRDLQTCLLYTSPSPRDLSTSRMPSSA